MLSNDLIGSQKAPWITQSIRREINQRDRLYQKCKRSKDPQNRRSFINSKHSVQRKIKLAYDKYLEDILGLMMKQVVNPFAGRGCLDS